MISIHFYVCFQSAWYTPYVKVPGRNQKIAAKGRLIDKRNNLIKRFKKCGYYADYPDDLESSNSQKSHDKIHLSEDTEGKLNWLKTCLEPWNTVAKYWNDTHKYRLQNLCESNSPLLHEYYDEFSVLKQPLGYTLVSLFK